MRAPRPITFRDGLPPLAFRHGELERWAVDTAKYAAELGCLPALARAVWALLDDEARAALAQPGVP